MLIKRFSILCIILQSLWPSLVPLKFFFGFQNFQACLAFWLDCCWIRMSGFILWYLRRIPIQLWYCSSCEVQGVIKISFQWFTSMQKLCGTFILMNLVARHKTMTMSSLFSHCLGDLVVLRLFRSRRERLLVQLQSLSVLDVLLLIQRHH